MGLAKRETELRDRLHEAVDSMSMLEVIVLIFLVQYIHTRGVVSNFFKPQPKELPEPDKPTLVNGWSVARVLGPEIDVEQMDFGDYLAAMEKIITDANQRLWNGDPNAEPGAFDGLGALVGERWNDGGVALNPPRSIGYDVPGSMWSIDAHGRPRQMGGEFSVPDFSVGYCTPSRVGSLTLRGEANGPVEIEAVMVEPMTSEYAPWL